MLHYTPEPFDDLSDPQKWIRRVESKVLTAWETPKLPLRNSNCSTYRAPRFHTRDLIERTSSPKGEGLFNVATSSSAFLSVKNITDRSTFDAILSSQKSRGSLAPGLKEQYDLQIQALERGGAECELDYIPGFMSYFSKLSRFRFFCFMNKQCWQICPILRSFILLS